MDVVTMDLDTWIDEVEVDEVETETWTPTKCEWLPIW